MGLGKGRSLINSKQAYLAQLLIVKWDVVIFSEKRYEDNWVIREVALRHLDKRRVLQ